MSQSFFAFATRRLRFVVLTTLGFLVSAFGAVNDVMDWWGEGPSNLVLYLTGLSLFFVGLLVLAFQIHQETQKPSIRTANIEDEREQPLTRVEEKRFYNCEVVIDGCDYYDCVFENVTFKFDGGPYRFNGNKIAGSRIISTSNDNITRFMQFGISLHLIDIPVVGNDGVKTADEYRKAYGNVEARPTT